MWCVHEEKVPGNSVATIFRAPGFFFQAEDGIRDLTVTGVQTCALPIWATTASSTCPPRNCSPTTSPPNALARSTPRRRHPNPWPPETPTGTTTRPVFPAGPRSEERRVGQERRRPRRRHRRHHAETARRR